MELSASCGHRAIFLFSVLAATWQATKSHTHILPPPPPQPAVENLGGEGQGGDPVTISIMNHQQYFPKPPRHLTLVSKNVNSTHSRSPDPLLHHTLFKMSVCNT